MYIYTISISTKYSLKYYLLYKQKYNNLNISIYQITATILVLMRHSSQPNGFHVLKDFSSSLHLHSLIHI